jgi:hypothetical protein
VHALWLRSSGKPDAGNPPVRFEEGGGGRVPAPPLLDQPADEPLDLDAELLELGRQIAAQRVRLDANQVELDQMLAKKRE